MHNFLNNQMVKQTRMFILENLLKVVKFGEQYLPLKNIIVFECENDMDDNPRAYYEYLISHDVGKPFLFVWLVKDLDYCKTHFSHNKTVFITRYDRSFRNLARLYFYLRSARYLIFSHPYWYKKTNPKQIVININHGIPIKKGSTNMDIYKSFDYIPAQSELAKQWIMKFWHTYNNQMIITGIPRNDLLFSGNKSLIFSKLFDFQKDDKVIICMPTYRQSSSQTDCQIEDKFSVSVISSEEEMKTLNTKLRDNNIYLLIKPHPLQKTDNLIINNYSNILYINNRLLLEKNILFYELLGCTDGLITDVSSVSLDYLLVNKPIAYLMKDFNDYSRGFVMDNPKDYMIGDQIYTFGDLMQFVDNIANNSDKYFQERKKLNGIINTYGMKENSKRFHESILSLR